MPQGTVFKVCTRLGWDAEVLRSLPAGAAGVPRPPAAVSLLAPAVEA